MHPSALRQIEEQGWLLLPEVLSADACDELVAALATPGQGRSRAGRRDALRPPAVVRLISSKEMRSLVDAILGGPSFAVRGLFFDKTPQANWQVPWHRDRTVAVRSRILVPGFDLWSIKDQVHHVEPPWQVMAGMLTARFHLDEVGPDQGPLRVLPGSHRDPAENQVDPDHAVHVVAPRGSLLLMRPLLRHASSPARSPRHRRVLQVEFANQELPGGLHWKLRI